METCDGLLEKVKSYAPDADAELLRKAFALSQKAAPSAPAAASKDAGRPLAVAYLLADMRLDIDTLSAGMVFSAVQEKRISAGDVATELGEDIAGIVAEAQALCRVSYRSSADEQAEAFRRMIMAMAKDLRALLVRLAARLRTLQTISGLDPHLQRQIASETLDIYAPIANRLGIQIFRAQFEDLALAVLQPQEYRRIDQFLGRRKETDRRFLTRVERELLRMGRAHDPEVSVTARTKHRAAILQKMRKRGIKLEDVTDLVGFRVLLGETAACYALLGEVHGRWEPLHERFRDYIGRPKSNGYQSLQTTLLAPGGERFEVQIRTRDMHRVAELGVAAHWRYKEGHLDLSQGELEQYTRIHQLTRLLDEIQDPQELVDVLKVDLFADEIFLYTPQGDLKWLPLGATALDFAFSVHSEVGLRCAGARVNGQLVALRHKLQSGDRVDIMTRKNQHPGRDWMRMAVTSRARSKIRGYLKSLQRSGDRERGQQLLEKELQRREQKLSRMERSLAFSRALEQLKVRDADELFARLGNGELPLERALRALLPEEEKSAVASIAPVKPARRRSQTGRWPVLVQGMDGILTVLARCCQPVPGEQIVGYITRGRGVTVHRPDCSQARRLDPERTVPVSWSTDSGDTHLVRIRVVMSDWPGMLAAVTRRIGLLKINIVSCQLRTGEDAFARAVIGLAVRDLGQLADAVKKISQVKGVISVDRM